MAQHTHYPMIIEWQGPMRRRDICECGYYRHVVLLRGVKVFEDWLPGNLSEPEKKSRHQHKAYVVMEGDNILRQICKCGAVRYFSDNNGLYPDGSSWSQNTTQGERYKLYLLEK